MNRPLRHPFWIVDLVFLASMAWVAASTVGALVEHALWVWPDADSTDGDRANPPPRLPKLEVSRLAALTGLPMPAVPKVPAPPKFDPSVDPVRTKLSLRLLGTLIAQRPEWSLATIEDLQARDWASYGVGESLGDARVLAIERSRVMLLVNGRREFLPHTPAARTVPTAPQATPTLARTGVPSTAPLGAGIRALNANTYDVPREEVGRVLSNLNSLAMKARIMPAFRDGRAIGFKVFSIRPDSLYTRIGIQNGDVLRRINGLDLNSPEKALEVYTRMKDATRIDLELERRGQVVRKTYHVR
jgi:general secretion pathway protein C